ncbi:MAG: YXWGXW repeat-containing protein [Bacteroidia bacterium]
MKKLTVLSIVALSLLGMTKIDAQVGVSVQISTAPPEIPVYVQPMCPIEGYMWSPGYWAYGTYGYYWVPGVWISPPTVGYLWTPGYWGFNGGIYAWNGGYWGTNIGFYGGVNYGYGYGGSGYYGGRWEGGAFRYNSAVCNVNSSFHNTYVDRTVIINNNNHTSFNGAGGISTRPNAAEESAMKEKHVQPTSAQQAHQHSASISKNQRASMNGGHPSIAAKSSVGGQRYNSTGHSIAAPVHKATTATPAHTSAQHAASAAPHTAQPAQQHQAQHSASPAPQHHTPPVQQHQAQHGSTPALQHQTQPTQQQSASAQQHQPPMQQHKGGAPSHGGGGGRK